MLRYDTRRAFLLRWVYLGGLCIVILAYISRLDLICEVWEKGELLEHDWTLNFITETLCGESLLFVLPVLSTLPFSSSFIDEWKAGITHLAISRIEKHIYLRSKAIVTALSGGFILSAGILFLLIISMIVFLPVEQQQAADTVIGNKPLQSYIELFARYFVCGALWAEVGLFFSTLFNHRFLAWLSPFMIYYLLIIFHERYFEWCFVLYPKEWLIPEREWFFNNWSICLWLLVLTAFAGWGFVKIGGRRLVSG